MLAYAEAMPRVDAQRMLDAAQAAAFPHRTKDNAASWLRDLGRVIQAARQTVSDAAEFRWNGRPVSLGGLKRRMARAFGRGFSED